MPAIRPLFTQLELPGMNALTAGSFDASVSFDANMPASHVAYSLGALGMYLDPGQVNGRPGAIKVNEDPCTQGRNIFGGCGPVFGDKPLQSDGDTAAAGSGGLISEDFLRRVGLFMLALVLIAVALWKL